MNSIWEKAVRTGDAAAVSSLLADLQHLNSKDRYGQTALMIAAIGGHKELVRILVEHGAELNVTAKYNLTALMLAVLNNHAEIVEILAEAGAEQQIRGSGAPGFYNKTALELAEHAGREEIANILRKSSSPKE